MTMRIMLALALASVVLSPRLARAGGPAMESCSTSGEADVWLMKTGGFWRSGGRYGHYRVVVKRVGVEHAIDWAELQIVEVDDRGNTRRITRCVPLRSPGLKGYVADVAFTKVDDTHANISLSIEMKALGRALRSEVFQVSPSEPPRRLVEAKGSEPDDPPAR
jgi:hypothetical protein